MPLVGDEAHILLEHRLIPCLFDLGRYRSMDRRVPAAARRAGTRGTPRRDRNPPARSWRGGTRYPAWRRCPSVPPRRDVADEPSGPRGRAVGAVESAPAPSVPRGPGDVSGCAGKLRELRGDVSRRGLSLRSGAARNRAVRPRPSLPAHDTPGATGRDAPSATRTDRDGGARRERGLRGRGDVRCRAPGRSGARRVRRRHPALALPVRAPVRGRGRRVPGCRCSEPSRWT